MDTSFELFYNKFLVSWSSYNCPISFFRENKNLMKNSYCMKCGESSSLWLCVSCNHTGCSHDVNDHAMEHYRETKHNFAMDLSTYDVIDFKSKKILSNTDDIDNKIHYVGDSNNEEMENIGCNCNVCRHVRTAKLFKRPVCMKCERGKSGSLWVCLACKYIGCDRQQYGCHAYQHYRKTNHIHFMQLYNSNIWNYEKIKFAHRNLNKTLEKNEIVEYGRNRHLKRDALEFESENLRKLSETNNKLIAAEERLLNFTQQKNIVEGKLHEHDVKLNILLNELTGNCQNALQVCSENFEALNDTENLQKENSIQINVLNYNAISLSNPVEDSQFTIPTFIPLVIFGLVFIYQFLMKSFQNIICNEN